MKKKISNRKKDKSNSVKTPNIIAPDASTGTKPAGRKNEETSPKKPLNVSEVVRETLFNSFEHSYVVVNEDSDIIEVYGDIRPFLGPSSEQIERNLLRMVNSELQIELRSALSKATRNRIVVKSQIKKFELHGSEHYVRILIKPLVDQTAGEELYVVIFEKIDINDFLSGRVGTETGTAGNSRIIELERELSTTKQHLKNYIEKMESSYEAFQSNNEELETSKEELQSSNEEIQIAHSELKALNEKLERKVKKPIKNQANNNLVLSTKDLSSSLPYETQLSIITNNLPVVIFQYKLNANGTDEITYLSEGASKLWGVDASTLMENPHKLWGIFHADDLRGVREAIHQSAKTMQTWEAEWRINHPDGSIRWQKGNGTPLRQQDDSTLWACLVLDVTDRKNAELLAENHRQEIEKVLDRSLDFICTLSADGNFTKVSAAAADIIGYEPEELVGKKFLNFVYEEDRPKTELVANEIMGGKEFTNFNNRYVHKNGSLVPIMWSAYWDDTDALMYCVGRDATDLQRAEEQIARNERRFRTLIENSGDAFAIIGIDGKPTYTSTSMVRILGYSEEEALETNMFSILHPDDVDGVTAKMQEILENPGVPLPGHTARGRHKDGSWRWLEATVTNLLHDPEINGIVDNFRDVTERVNTEISLKESEEKYRILFNYSPLPKWIYNRVTFEILDVNLAAREKYGYTYEEFLSMTLKQLRPKEYIPKLIQAHEGIDQKEGLIRFGIHNHITKKGIRMKMDISGQKINFKNQPCVMVVCNDVTEREWIREIELLERSLMHDSIMTPADLKIHLNIYLTGIEQIYGDLKTSVFMVKEDRLIKLASPSLPAKFLKAIDNRAIGLTLGSCGAAALTGKKVTVEDIGTSPLWDELRTLAFDQGIRSSCSIPIFDSSRKVIATLAYYYPTAKKPSKNDLKLFERSAGLLSIILENHLKSRALSASNELNNYVNMATNDAIYDWDVLSDQFNWGVSFTRIFGHNFTNAHFSLKTWIELTHPKDLEKNKNARKAFWTDPTQNKWTNEFQFLRADGTYAFVEEIGHLIRDERGKPKRMIGVLRDKTAQKEEEGRLRLMESVITNTTDSVLITDADTTSKTGPHIIYVNEAFTQITGYTSEEVFGRSPRMLQGPKTDSNELKKLGEAIRTGKSHEVTLQNYRKNGEVFWFHISVSPIADEMGDFTHWIAIQRDVTKQKNAEIQKRLIGEISQMFNIGDSIVASLENILQHLLRFGEFNLAEAWLVSADHKQINLAASYPQTPETRRFYKADSFIKSMKKGEGLVGGVWNQRKTAVWDKIDRKKAFLRKNGAIKTGLKSALGLPLIHNNDVVGVLVFATDTPGEKLTFYESFFKELESTLGLELRRKQLEDELHQLFQNSPDMLCIVGDDGKFLKANPAFADLMGYDAHELNSLSMAGLIHPEDKQFSEEAYLGMLNGQLEGEELVHRYITKSGRYRWISWSATRLNNEDGFSFAYGRDITERKELQDLLDNANRLARIGGWEVDLLNNTLYLSRITKEIHEIPADYQPDLDSAINFYRDDVRELVKNYVNETIEHGTTWDFELPIITAKGNERWVRSIGQSEFSGGKCVRLYGSFQDIHEKRVAEMRLKNMADNVPGVIFRFILHEDGANEMLNLTKGAHTLWGASAEACMNDPEIIWNQTRAGGDYDHVMETILLSAKTLNQWKCQYRSRNPDGRVLWLEGSGSPQRLPNGSVLWDTLLIDISDKKELEDLLKRSSQMARIGSWELRMNQEGSDEMYWSDMTREILGVDQAYNPSLFGSFEFYSEVSRIEIQNAVANLIENGIDFDLELLITTAKNQPRWIRCIGQSERIENRCIKIFGSFQDIHQRKIAELEVHKAFEEKNTILESIGDAFFAVDRDFTVTYWNKEAEYALNTKREDILNRKLWDVFGDAVDLEFGHQYRHAMKTEESVTFEAYYPGEKKWFEVSVYPSDMGLSVYFKDVSQRRTTEERIRQSNERFEKVSEATNDAIWDWDIETNHLYWGKGFNTIFGYDLEGEVPTLKAWTKYIYKEDLKKVMDSLDAVIEDASRSNWQQEYRYQKESGEYAFVMDRGVVIRDESGKAIRMVGAMSDITQRKTFEESLQKLNERLDLRAEQLAISNADLEQFAFVASHDLQEPLRMVTSFLSQLDRKYTGVLDDKGRQYIHFAVDGAKRMRQIILDLLEFSRVGRQEVAGEKIDLNKLMDETIAIHGKVIEERDAKIHVELLPTVFSQKAPLLQVFQNLIGNALKYTDKDIKPEISVTVSETKNDWTIALRDNGIGIDAEYFEKIFIIFQRLHAKDEFEGTGMGLAIVKKIIENLGGKIWVESKEGHGSTFFFTIFKAEKI